MKIALFFIVIIDVITVLVVSTPIFKFNLLPHLNSGNIASSTPVRYVVETIAAPVNLLKSSGLELLGANDTTRVTYVVSEGALDFNKLDFNPHSEGIFDPYRKLFHYFKSVVANQTESTTEESSASSTTTTTIPTTTATATTTTTTTTDSSTTTTTTTTTESEGEVEQESK